MKLTRRKWLTITSAFVAIISSGQSFASGKVIKVSLWDRGASAMNMLGHGPMMGMGMGAMGKDMPMAPMGIKLSSQTVAAGEVTFEVKNASKQMVHEMVISPLKDANDPLPYMKDSDKVDEDAAGHLGEVAELEPGKSGALRLTLKPGRYILYCNIPGHYVLGMWTLLTVKG
ncbi:MAG: hypothetical protein ABI575_05510 [Oxalobacteraceae bacterium]